MSGLLDLYAAQAGPTSPPLVSIPSTPGERFGAEYESATAPDRWFNVNGARRDWFQKTIDEIHTETGQSFANPYNAITPEEMQRLGNQPAIIDERRNKIIDANRALREVKPEAINAEGIDQFIGVEGDAARQRAAGSVGTGNGVAGFLGGMLAPTPENILGAMVPPSRLVLGAVAPARSFLAGLAREAAYQGVVGAGLTAGTEALDMMARQATGTAPEFGEVAGNVVAGGVGGALLGGAFHLLHAGPKALWERWTALPEDVRANAPLEVKDAFHALEREALYGNQNRLGIDPMLHERYQGRALDSVLRGTPPRFEDLAQAGDTSTGLSTIFRMGAGEPRGPREQISAMTALDQIAAMRALPDSEIEPFARQVRPNSFARIDRIEGDLSELRTQISDIGSRTPAIADLVDPDTAIRLRAIEQDMKAPALAKKQRLALEQERDMILQTVDPKDRLPKQAEREQTKQLAELQEKVTKLEAQREEAKATADQAVADLRRKLGRYGEDFQPEQAVTDFGLKVPADLERAIQRADFERNARVVRETLPGGAEPKAAPVETVADPQLEAAVKPLVESKPSHLRDLIKELDLHDLSLKDAKAALACANAGGLP